MKTVVIRFINGFCYAVAITMLVQVAVMLHTKTSSMLPEYMARFENPVMAYAVQLLLIGIMSGVSSAGGILMEYKRLGLVVQSILFFLLMLITWVPIACFLWGMHKYTTSLISTLLSLLVTYGICWGIQYKICAQDIKEINERLQAKKEV